MSHSPRKQSTLFEVWGKSKGHKTKEKLGANGRSAAKVSDSADVDNSAPKHRKVAEKPKLKMGLIFGKPDGPKETRIKMMRDRSSRDLEQYRNGYPNKADHADLKENLLFYSNQIPSKPDGDCIDVIHKEWWGNYDKLEIHHGYIQWLFPIREPGMNYHSQELQPHEAKAIMADPESYERVLTSYKMMLDFYGMQVKDDGTVSRAEHWEPRFKHLNRSMHNYLRISRILKCLGEFEYEHLKKPFVEFLVEEAAHHRTLENTLESLIVYWIETVKDDKQRNDLRALVKTYTQT